MGLLGLPLNLLLFQITGKIEYFPSDFMMVQISCMILGIGLGLNGSYLKKLHREIEERHVRENDLKNALADKELLFKELNHRVKNNLNLIKSLIQLQIYRSSSKSFKREGEKLINRILTISLVHEQLYSGHLGDLIDLNSYFERLVNHILSSQSHEMIKRGYESSIEFTTISLDKAILLGLIANEIITNSLKYAFPSDFSGSPKIILNLKIRHGFLMLNIEDNGKGIDPDDQAGLGMTLVESLSQQLNGKYGYDKSNSGTKFYFTMVL